ncbi:MAG: hypothetical protein KDD46_04485 [Bdellovibrionales bacterium]|nr:hypothetical protein [Bdellovibrionales bacterium]
MRFRNTFALVCMILVVSCEQKQTQQVQIVRVENPFQMMDELSKSADPFVIYQEVYPSFSFESEAFLQQINDAGETISEMKAQTKLKQKENQYYHIERTPFSPVPSVEMIFDQGLLFLRPHLEETFYQIKNNPEVSNLRKTIFFEIMYYYDFEALKKEQPVQKNNQDCYYKNQDFICFDSNTYLPLSGKISQPQPQAGQIVVGFRLSPGEEEIQTVKPEKVHLLRKHLII